MTLIEDWEVVVRKFWSFRFAVVSAILSGAEVAVQIWHPASIPDGAFAGIAAVVSIAAAGSRVIAQPEAYKHDADK